MQEKNFGGIVGIGLCSIRNSPENYGCGKSRTLALHKAPPFVIAGPDRNLNRDRDSGSKAGMTTALYNHMFLN